MSEKIDYFAGRYEFLSNFFPCICYFEGILFPSVENAYQAAKTLDIKEREKFRNVSAGKAKQMGNRLKLRDDWERVKTDVMLDCLRSKFSFHPLRDNLLDTGYAYLIEGNHHGDRIWGQVDGVGENRLGRLLMQVREELRQDKIPEEFLKYQVTTLLYKP